jgi:LPS sulfotransferase NodH
VLQDVPLRPIFIVGAHRSGTTLLHRLLAQTGCFNYLSAYQVLRYDEILAHHAEGTTAAEKAKLMREFDELGLKNRIIDDAVRRERAVAGRGVHQSGRGSVPAA